MKKVALVSAILLWSSATHAQLPAAPATEDRKPADPVEERRIKTLEDQGQTLAEEVAVLRGELKAGRDAKSAESPSDARVWLASSGVAPGALSATMPSPEGPAQAAQTSQLSQSQM